MATKKRSTKPLYRALDPNNLRYKKLTNCSFGYYRKFDNHHKAPFVISDYRTGGEVGMTYSEARALHRWLGAALKNK